MVDDEPATGQTIVYLPGIGNVGPGVKGRLAGWTSYRALEARFCKMQEQENKDFTLNNWYSEAGVPIIDLPRKTLGNLCCTSPGGRECSPKEEE